MYLKTRDQAVEALSVILQETDPKVQLIEVTMRIALCLDPEARLFLLDCQRALIQGGLEALRKSRKQQLEALAGKYEAPPADEATPDVYVMVEIEAPPEPIVLVPPPPSDDFEEMEVAEFVPEPSEPIVVAESEEKPPEPLEPIVVAESEEKPKPEPPPEPVKQEPKKVKVSLPSALTPDKLLDPLLEEIGTGIDLLKVADIARQVFPRVREERGKWEVGRQIAKHEEEVRALIVDGMRNRGDQAKIDQLETTLLTMIEKDKPYWLDWANSMKETCKYAVQTMKRFGKVHPDANDSDNLFNVIAISDERAKELMNEVTKSPADAVSYVSEIRTRVDWVMTADEQDQ